MWQKLFVYLSRMAFFGSLIGTTTKAVPQPRLEIGNSDCVVLPLHWFDLLHRYTCWPARPIYPFWAYFFALGSSNSEGDWWNSKWKILDHFSPSFFSKNDNFKTQDFSPLIERVLAGVIIFSEIFVEYPKCHWIKSALYMLQT